MACKLWPFNTVSEETDYQSQEFPAPVLVKKLKRPRAVELQVSMCRLSCSNTSEVGRSHDCFANSNDRPVHADNKACILLQIRVVIISDICLYQGLGNLVFSDSGETTFCHDLQTPV